MSRKLYGFAFRILRNQEESEDAVQEVFIAIFRYLQDASKIPEPSPDLETRIIAGLDFSKNQGRIRRLLIALSGVAAAIIILIGTWFFFSNSNKPGDTFTDPQLAYEETLKILYGVSSRMNQGAAAMEPFTKINSPLRSLQVISKSTETFQNSFRSLDHLQKAIELTQSPSNRNNNK